MNNDADCRKAQTSESRNLSVVDNLHGPSNNNSNRLPSKTQVLRRLGLSPDLLPLRESNSEPCLPRVVVEETEELRSAAWYQPGLPRYNHRPLPH